MGRRRPVRQDRLGTNRGPTAKRFRLIGLCVAVGTSPHPARPTGGAGSHCPGLDSISTFTVHTRESGYRMPTAASLSRPITREGELPPCPRHRHSTDGKANTESGHELSAPPPRVESGAARWPYRVSHRSSIRGRFGATSGHACVRVGRDGRKRFPSSRGRLRTDLRSDPPAAAPTPLIRPRACFCASASGAASQGGERKQQAPGHHIRAARRVTSRRDGRLLPHPTTSGDAG
jgi:hypothetical protein